MENTVGSFRTARLVIRRFAEADWAAIQELARDKESSDGAIYDHTWPTSDEGCREMADWCAGQESCFAVHLRSGKMLIGLLRFNSIDERGRLDLGHMFHTRCRRDGYDTEAIRCMLAVALADQEVVSVIAKNAVQWTGQLEPLRELGFREVGRGKGSFAKDDQGRDVEFIGCTMEMTKEDWLQRRGKDEPEAPR